VARGGSPPSLYAIFHIHIKNARHFYPENEPAMALERFFYETENPGAGNADLKETERP
jgi:hypothetical protein